MLLTHLNILPHDVFKNCCSKCSPYPSGTRGGAPADPGAVDPSPNRTGTTAGGPQEGSAEEAAGSHPDLLTPEYRHSPLRQIHMSTFFLNNIIYNIIHQQPYMAQKLYDIII